MRDESSDTTSQAAPKSRLRTTNRWLLAAILLLAAVASFLGVYRSRPQTEVAPKTFAMGWRPVASQSGHGSAQTESFHIETGQWRIKWAATLEADAGSARSTESQATPSETEQVSPANEFRLAVHSAVSGRFMAMAVDHQGPGSGVAYVAEEPRPFFLVIQSEDHHWTVEVEEGLGGEQKPK